ncbi:MAG: hypothetical protein K8T26_08005 [Lentisphaerae bacterium]|nr:hypothetical protein [Lentisphaerota bacterium]
MSTLESLSLGGLGQFTTDFAGFSVQRYHLPREWDHILGDERLFWRVHHNGKSYLQENPPGGMYWLRANAEHDTPPWQCFLLPDGEAASAFTNFRGPLADDVVTAEVAGEFECRWYPEKAVWTVKRAGLVVKTEMATLSRVVAAALRMTVTNTGSTPREVVVMPRLTPWLTATQAAAWDMPWLFQTCSYDAATRSVRMGMGSPAGRPEQRRALRLVTDTDFERLSFDAAGFVGRGTREWPAALKEWRAWPAARTSDTYGYPLFVAFASTVRLAPGASWQCRMVLADDVNPVAMLQETLGQLDAEMAAVAAHKHKLLTRAAVRTPDAAFTRYINEYLSLQQQLVLRRGWPSNMRGVRDTAQDYTGPAAWYPAEVRRTILEILETERADGWFVRQYSTDGRHGRHDARPYVDSGLWVWEMVYEYVCQNRDFALLNETLPFLDSDSTTTVLDHLGRLLNYYLTPANIGEHGLCKILEGDWNDSANRAGLEGRGESVMVSCHLIYCLRQAAQLRQHLGAGGVGLPEPAACLRAADEMRGRIRQHALNPLGYLNGVFSDRGCWFFSDRDPDGQVRFNVPVNAFGIIAGVFEPAELPALLARLRGIRTPHGYPLFTPALGHPPVDGLGRIGSGDLPPGLGENGTCYNHGCHGFLARALAVAGEGDLCFDVMEYLLPYDQVRHPIAASRSAPYAVVNVYKGAPGREGEGGDTFFSGTIAVAVRNVYQSMLGAWAEPGGLRFSPCLPTAWKRMDARLPYAGRDLAVVVERQERGYAVSVDGQLLADGWLPAR